MPTSSKLPSLTDFRTLPHPVCRQEVGIVSGLWVDYEWIHYNLSPRHKNTHAPRDTHNARRTVIASRTVIAPRSVLVPCVLAITGGTPWKLSLNNDR